MTGPICAPSIAIGTARASARRLIIAFLSLFAFMCTEPRTVAAAEPGAVLLVIDGPIGPATSDYVERGLETAGERGASVVILRIDTPGGLDTSMRDIIQSIIASPMPVFSYVGPSGARAASAGTYILYASHVAAMAPGTNLGAATPIQIGGGSPIPLPGGAKDKEGGDKDKVGKDAETKKTAHPELADKAIGDAVAYIRSLAQMRGRNVEWAEKAVREAASLPAEEAVKAGVVDLLANNVRDLLTKADGRVVDVQDKKQRLETAALAVEAVEPDWRSNLLAVLTNPNIAYILMLIGIYGLIFEFTNPGAIAPGVIGAISLLLALFALHVLPVNYAGLALIILGIAFMVAEAFLPLFGALGVGGVIAFVVGSVMLLDTDIPGFGVSWQVIAAVGGLSAAAFVVVLVLAVRAQKRPVVSGRERMVGSAGEVVDWSGDAGRVRIHGEIWQASAPEPLAAGSTVAVAAIDGLTLVVRPAMAGEPKGTGGTPDAD